MKITDRLRRRVKKALGVNGQDNKTELVLTHLRNSTVTKWKIIVTSDPAFSYRKHHKVDYKGYSATYKIGVLFCGIGRYRYQYLMLGR